MGYHTECVCIRRGGGCVLCNDVKFGIITQLSGKIRRVNNYGKTLYSILYLSSIDENQKIN